jgi:outer membrane lipoprotein-sorting protein
MRTKAYLALILCLIATVVLAQPEPKEIIRKMEEQMRGDQSYTEMKMTIVRPRYTREMEMKSWSKGEDYSLILITAPARDRGTAFLKRKKEIWNWVPNIERMIKMPPSMMAQSWMGTDFSNDDLVRESSTIDDFTHSLLREEKRDGIDCFVVQMVPNPDAAVVYEKVLVWVSKGDYLQVRVENYDEYGELVNHIQFSEIREIGGRKIPAKMELVPADKRGHKTIIEYINGDFDTPIQESFFSVQNLRQVR